MNLGQKLDVDCACAGCCTIARFEHYNFGDNNPQEVFVDFYVSNTRADWRYRLGRIWNLLRDRQNDWSHCLVLEAPQLTRLHDWIEEVLHNE